MSAEPNSKFAPEPQITHKGRELSFKQKLDQAAHDARKSEEEPKQNPIVEKGWSSITTHPSCLAIMSKHITAVPTTSIISTA